MASTAYYLSEKIPGRGQATYAKHFTAGVLCPLDSILKDKKGKPIKVKDCEVACFPCSATGGKSGRGGSTVTRYFPMIAPGWQASFEIHVVDDVILEGVFKRTLEQMGIINGAGRFRPQNGGTNGRFKVTKFRWIKQG